MKPVLKLASGDTMNLTIDATSSSVPHLQKKVAICNCFNAELSMVDAFMVLPILKSKCGVAFVVAASTICKKILTAEILGFPKIFAVARP